MEKLPAVEGALPLMSHPEFNPQTSSDAQPAAGNSTASPFLWWGELSLPLS